VKRWLLAALVLLIGKLRRRRALPPGRRVREPDRRAENLTFLLLFVAMAAAAAFTVFYFANPDTQFLGATLGLALVLLGGACAVAGKRVVPQIEGVKERPELEHPFEQDEVMSVIAEGGEGVTRKRFFLLAGGGAAGLVFSLLRSRAGRRRIASSAGRRGIAGCPSSMSSMSRSLLRESSSASWSPGFRRARTRRTSPPR
jgi:peptidoglycan/LPS O-acetylase OafA/YrhL